MKALVRCSFMIEVELPDLPDYDPYFDIEENHCPGTGIVGAALTAHMAKHDLQRTCWACALQGKNVIIQQGE